MRQRTISDHYDDACGDPAWSNTLTIDGTSTTKRYVDGIDGDLAATVTDDGTGTPTVKLDLTNLHGDTVASIDRPQPASPVTASPPNMAYPATQPMQLTTTAGWAPRNAAVTTSAA